VHDSNKSPTRCNKFSNLLSWRLFTAQHVSGVSPPIIRSSVTAMAASGSTFVSRWYSSARPRTQHDCHHNTKVKPEVATAVIELLMIGGKTPETCCTVNKRQDNKLENLLHLVGDLFELYDDARTYKTQNFVHDCIKISMPSLWSVNFLIPLIPRSRQPTVRCRTKIASFHNF